MKQQDELKDMAIGLSLVGADLFFEMAYDTVFEEYGGTCDEEALAVVYNLVAEEAAALLIKELKTRK